MIVRASILIALYAAAYKLHNKVFGEYFGYSEPPGGAKNGDFFKILLFKLWSFRRLRLLRAAPSDQNTHQTAYFKADNVLHIMHLIKRLQLS